MRHKLQSGLQILFLPLMAGMAMGQTAPAQSHPAAAPPAALKSIFGSALGSKLAASDTTTVSISAGGIVPIYSAATTIQPGSFVSIYGQNLATGVNAPASFTFPESLSGTSVTINNKPAYMYFVSPGQIDIQAPDDTATGTVPVVVTTPTGSATSTVTLGTFGPSFLQFGTLHVTGIIVRSDGTGTQGGGAYDFLGPQGSSLGFVTVPAKAGNAIELFGVGFGPTNPPVPAGAVYSGPATGAPTVNPVTLFINGTAITPDFAGITEAGLYQFTIFSLPSGLGTGDVPLIAQVGGVQTPTGVVISLQ